MAAKSFRNSTILVLVIFVTLSVLDEAVNAATSERPFQRRRRPVTGEITSETDGNPMVPQQATRFNFSQRRGANKLTQATTVSSGTKNKSLQADIALSCKSEPGCEWNCSENDSECICRCKFHQAAANPRVSSSSSEATKVNA